MLLHKGQFVRHDASVTFPIEGIFEVTGSDSVGPEFTEPNVSNLGGNALGATRILVDSKARRHPYTYPETVATNSHTHPPFGATFRQLDAICV